MNLYITELDLDRIENNCINSIQQISNDWYIIILKDGSLVEACTEKPNKSYVKMDESRIPDNIK